MHETTRGGDRGKSRRCYERAKRKEDPRTESRSKNIRSERLKVNFGVVDNIFAVMEVESSQPCRCFPILAWPYFPCGVAGTARLEASRRPPILFPQTSQILFLTHDFYPLAITTMHQLRFVFLWTMYLLFLSRPRSN